MHGALVISGVGKVRQAEYLERLRFQLLVEHREKYQADLGRQPERLLKARGLLKGQGLHIAYCSGERTGRQKYPCALCLAGWELK